MRYFIFYFAFLLPVFLSSGSPAPQRQVIFTQPDGSKITITIQGDEYLKWAYTTDNYTIIANEEGYYVYAVKDREGNLIPSTVTVHNIGDRNKAEINFISGIEKGLFFSPNQLKNTRNTSRNSARVTGAREFPTKGKNKLICILVSFQDRPFNLSKNDFTRLFNEQGYSVNEATGSVRDYYLEASYNQLDLQTDVYGPYLLSQDESYYGSNSNDDGGAKAMAKEAVQLADKDIDFSLYDIDGDSEIEGLYILTADKDEMSGGSTGAIWPHRGSFPKDTPKLDGMSFQDYAASGELDHDGSVNTIGTIVHEIGHLLGARDFYDVDNSDGGKYPGIGGWGLMSGGNHNNRSRTPAHPNAYVKTAVFKWATSNLLISQQKNIQLKNIVENSDQYYYFNTPTANEYFILENRVKTGFDKYLPGEGLIIYHAHADLTPTYGGPNNTHPQMLYPVCAGAGTDPYENNADSYGEINSNLCPFPGEKSIKGFTFNTLPSNRSWAGEEAYGHLTNIKFDYSTKIVSFNFLCDEPYDLRIRPVSSTQLRLAWNTPGEQKVVITRATIESFLTSLPKGREYSVGDYVTFENKVVYTGKANFFIDEGLEPTTNYYYHLWGMVDGKIEYLEPLRVKGATDPVLTKEFEKSLTEYFEEGVTRQYWQTLGYQDDDSEWQFKCDGSDPDYGCTTWTYSNKSELISPTIICEGYDSVRLRFNHHLSNMTYYIATVYYSVDDGENWRIIKLWSDIMVDKESTFYIPTYGAEKIKFKWEMSNQGASMWRLYYVIIDSFNNEVTGIGDVESAKISVYPVPVNGLLNIKMAGVSGNADVKLYNLYGEVVYHKRLTDVQRSTIHSFNTDQLSNGMYVLKIDSNGSGYSQKILINK